MTKATPQNKEVRIRLATSLCCALTLIDKAPVGFLDAAERDKIDRAFALLYEVYTDNLEEE